MITHADRCQAVALIDEAVAAGARCHKACQVLGISARTYQRWTRDDGVSADQRPEAERPEPANKLTDAEREAILAVANSPAYRSLPPSQIVPALADQGRYLASESSFYRVLRAANQQHHGAAVRRLSAAHRAPIVPPSIGDLSPLEYDRKSNATENIANH